MDNIKLSAVLKLQEQDQKERGVKVDLDAVAERVMNGGNASGTISPWTRKQRPCGVCRVVRSVSGVCGC